MQTLKQSLSMGIKDIDEALVIAQNMMADMRDKYPDVSRSRGDDEGLAVSQAPATSSTPQPPVPQVPLNEANPGNSSERSQTGSRNDRHANISVIKAVDTITENFRHINRPKGKFAVSCSIHAMLISIRV